MNWSVSVPPTSEPVSLEEAKAQLGLTTNDRDPYVDGLIARARVQIENESGRAIMPQTWVGVFRCFSNPHRLLGGKIRAIDSIKYYDSANVQQTLATSAYYAVLAEPAKIWPVEAWPDLYPRPDAVEITLSAGWVNAESVPAALKGAILLELEMQHDRSDAGYADGLRRARDALLFPYRTVLV